MRQPLEMRRDEEAEPREPSRQSLPEKCQAMSESSAKTFDCVLYMRQTRDRLSAEIDGMGYEELVAWLRGHRYSDPVLRRLAEEAARHADDAQWSSTSP